MKIIPERAEWRGSLTIMEMALLASSCRGLLIPYIFSLASLLTASEINLITMIQTLVRCVLCRKMGDERVLFLPPIFFFTSFFPFFFSSSQSLFPSVWPSRLKGSLSTPPFSSVNQNNAWRQETHRNVDRAVSLWYVQWVGRCTTVVAESNIGMKEEWQQMGLGSRFISKGVGFDAFRASWI